MKSIRNNKIAVIGGDPRLLSAAEALGSAGYTLTLYGFDPKPHLVERPAVDSGCCSDGWRPPSDFEAAIGRAGKLCKSPEEAIAGCGAVILPLPASTDGVHITMPLAPKDSLTPSDLVRMMRDAGVCVLFGGKLGSALTALCRNVGITACDYYEREEFAVANAVPTAEGAIAIAMEELPITLHGASALVIGGGRIGKVLADRLAGLCAAVTVTARKASDLMWTRVRGLTDARTGALAELLSGRKFDVIFNTVPQLVLSERELSRIPIGTPIIDLASKPGGVDFHAAKGMGHRVIWALSLPGKVAPVTSGRIIADTVISCLAEG